MKKIIIFGTNDEARLAHYCFTNDTPYTVAAFTVESDYIQEEKLLGLDIIPFESLETFFSPENYILFIAIGYKNLNQLRENIFYMCKEKGYTLTSYLDSRIHRFSDVIIGENCFIHYGTYLSPFVKVGNNVIINPGVIISHDCIVGNHCFIGPGTTINGRVSIGDNSIISSAAILTSGVKIGTRCIVGPGVVVRKDMQDEEVLLANGLDTSGIKSKSLANYENINIVRHKSRKNESIPFSDTKKTYAENTVFPLSPLQEAYWVGRRPDIELGGVSTHIYYEIEASDIDIERLEKALNRLIKRQSMLRATISPSGEQQILEYVPFYNIRSVNLQETSHETQEQKLQSLRREMAHQVLESDVWPLFDIRVVLLDNRKSILLLSFDLLIMDGRGLDLFSNEWSLLYKNTNTVLPKIDSSFFDYILETEKEKQSKTYKKDVEYWYKQIPTMPRPPQLPINKQGNKNTQHHFERYEYSLEISKLKKLRSSIENKKLNSTAVLLTIFAEILRVWSNNKDMTLNLSVIGRSARQSKYDNVIGQFSSTMLLAVELNTQMTFYEQVLKLQNKLYADLKHRSFSGIDVTREMLRDKQISDVSMPIVFTRHHSKGDVGKGSNHMAWLGKSRFTISQTPQVFLDYQLYEYGDEFTVIWDVIKDMFPKNMIQEMFNVHSDFLNRLATDPDIWYKTSVEIFQTLLPSSIKGIDASFNATERTVEPKLLHEGFLKHAERNPDAMALIVNEKIYTYGDLEYESSLIAHWLQENKVQANQPVAIVMEKSWEQIAAVIGVLRAGATYLPLDPTLPKKRLDYLLKHAEVKCILSTASLVESLQCPKEIQHYIVNNSKNQLRTKSVLEKADICLAKPDDMAYLIYTSGSTGLPKGVMVSHRNAVNTLNDMTERFAINSNDRILAVSSLSFDLSVFDIFAMLSCGGSIVIPVLENIKDPAYWHEAIRQYNITIWNSVPPLMQLLYEHAIQKKSDLESLRLILLSGDWIPLELPKQVYSIAKNTEIISLGGATEAGIWSIIYKIDKVDPEWNSIPYGNPLQNQHIYIYNNDLELCPVWVRGDIYIAGEGIALGYWKANELTEKSFIIHPETGKRLYKTGDLGRMHGDGFIEFLGRQDHQLKIRGFRVEPGEIEAALEKYPSIQNAVVVPEGMQKGADHLLAYFVTENNKPVNTNEIKQFMKQRLPEYMQPSRYIILDIFPLSPNGKVDRRALSEMHGGKEEKSHIAVNSESDTLHRVMKCIAEILHTTEFEAQDNFLNLGATSIDVIRLINRLDQEFGVRLTADRIYQLENIYDFATHLDQFSQKTTSMSSENNGVEIKQTHTLILDPIERKQFKALKPGLRKNVNERMSIALPDTTIDKELLDLWQNRRSHRHFSNKRISLEAFTKLLSALQTHAQSDGTAKYAYGSAGGLYPVQIYIYVKEDRIASLMSGIYYYHPEEHKLVCIDENTTVEGDIFDPLINRPIFEESAFSIFLIADLSAIEPMYGDRSLHYTTIEAGLISQLLEETAAFSDLGLCQIGELEFNKIELIFELNENQHHLHTLVGGHLL